MLFLLATIACEPDPSGDTGTVIEDTGLDCDTIADTDADGDGHGDPDTQVTSCEAQDGLVDNAGDCDDLDADVSPDGTEVCDGADNDCDGEYDEDSADRTTYYEDADGDGFGAAEVLACELPEGHVENADDCDDADAWVNPDADEICDSIDNDCDDVVDFDGWIPTDYATVADALDAVPDGAHFCIDEGTHDVDDLTYSSWLTLEGVGLDVVTLDAQESHFLEIEGDFELSGVHLTNITSQESYSIPGTYQLEGAVTLRDLEVSELESSGETATSYGLVSYCDYPCDLTVSNVDIHGLVWDHDADSWTSAGEVIEAWGGPVSIENLSISDLSATTYNWQPMLNTWAVGDLTASGIDISDVDIAVRADGGYGPFDMDAAGAVDVEDISASDLTMTLDDEDWSTGRLYAPALGNFDSDTNEASVRRVRLTDVLIEGSSDVTTIRGGLYNG
ncbi:MAG: hypothetical protein GY913_10600 [Proteobacteria bacterium]|nr:hypothetical protein [Pseudomonadota bacterium]MCP4917362.1 hypothetical protein [Pseudomonadota bacterium]